ncbi:MAG TPA: gamma-glutamyl-gamma-aminobutyrate hydrolase family protein [Leptospiraceae bacterium]|nr:gamma-glutamyl-gamma-aminobutyrate hydrolase family protein [Leptospiraceae bacterium]HMW06052.1 gamma-glutamyl-gamma-aminobutyrate hydrolase family protein [Leptospiraceae bacterium]HMX33922.1 gamma-glutamyl-gamma-aminobutyrate hydrolase family protein [Leptospiraceae bacterium]HMY31406.1 gamma-glutamyl-gamma-aminobutyrate hydrolase family protein [Leptospiraceae bacterium]HNA07479.1 gamma-glutamyl-gamma-aminobutyrate hydrolase family protein [Leptospiraceae bacterium]
MSAVLLILDPFLREPAFEAINQISKIHSEVVRDLKIDSRIEFFFPSHSSSSLKDYLDKFDANDKLIGVISLGSYANVGDNLDWVKQYGKDLKENIIEKGVPFFGICFSHQLLAWIYGANVSFIENRESLPEKKYNEFREITITHPKIKKIYNHKETFISRAKHEQEVKDLPIELELGGFSSHCKIEILVHKYLPAFSVQSHPEEFHETGEGILLVKNIIVFFYTWLGNWERIS